MHENDRRFRPRVVSDVDPVFVPLNKSLLVDHYYLEDGVSHERSRLSFECGRAGQRELFLTAAVAHAPNEINLHVPQALQLIAPAPATMPRSEDSDRIVLRGAA